MSQHTSRRSPALLVARIVALVAASSAISLWCWLLIDGTINGGITGGTYVVGGIMSAWRCWQRGARSRRDHGCLWSRLWRRFFRLVSTF